MIGGSPFTAQMDAVRRLHEELCSGLLDHSRPGPEASESAAGAVEQLVLRLKVVEQMAVEAQLHLAGGAAAPSPPAEVLAAAVAESEARLRSARDGLATLAAQLDARVSPQTHTHTRTPNEHQP